MNRRRKQGVNYQELEDPTIITLIARADEQALGELYERYSRLVYSMALNTLGDPSLAEEVTQDVYLRVWRKAGTYRAGQGKVLTWLSSITRYRCIDVYRRQSVRPESNQISWGDNPGLDLPDGLNVETEVELSQRSETIRTAMQSLPEQQRQALAMAFFLGYSHTEIADALGQPLGTVKTRIRSAMQKLRSELDRLKPVS